MSVQIIEFREKEYYEAVKTLNNAVIAINNVIPFMIEHKHPDISVSFFYHFTKDLTTTINDYFKFHLVEVCDFFGKPVESYNWITDDLIKGMTNKRVRYLYEAREKMNFSTRDFQNVINEKYIEIIDNVAYKKPDAEKLLKDQFTFYTENSLQEKAVKSIQVIAKELEKLNKMGISNNLLLSNYLFYLSGEEIKISSTYFKQYLGL